MERIPTPTFESPVQWLRVGDMQLHLFLDEGPAAGRHHLGITIDDFDAAYQAVKARTSDTWGWQLVELPSRQVQLYFRDPADNLIELNWPDADTLDRSRYPELRRLADHIPQTPDVGGSRPLPLPAATDGLARCGGPAPRRRRALARRAAARRCAIAGWTLLGVLVVAPAALGALPRADDREVRDELRLRRARPEGLPDHAS